MTNAQGTKKKVLDDVEIESTTSRMQIELEGRVEKTCQEGDFECGDCCLVTLTALPLS